MENLRTGISAPAVKSVTINAGKRSFAVKYCMAMVYALCDGRFSWIVGLPGC